MGTYVVTELECPGYIVDETQRIIHLHANDAPQFVFTNTNSAGEIVVFDLDPGVFSMVETATLTEPLALRACLKSSNKDGNKCKRKDLGSGM